MRRRWMRGTDIHQGTCTNTEVCTLNYHNETTLGISNGALISNSIFKRYPVKIKARPKCNEMRCLEFKTDGLNSRLKQTVSIAD